MKQKLSEWSRRYLAALQKHLKEGSRASLKPARGLGRQAVASGLHKLAVAMMHTQALAKLVAPHYSAGTKDELIKRAEIFFVEVMAPIEKTQRVAMETRVQLNLLNQTLRQRTKELAAANRQLQREMVRHQAAEEALQQGGQHQSQLLEQSRHRQIQLRPMSHQIPQPQEIRS
jgi:hypothetical protein